jgi:apolipoprotein N-acyltransferase
VWIVSFLVVLPSFFLAQMVNDHGWNVFVHRSRIVSLIRWRRLELIAYAAFFAFTVAWGVLSPVDYRDAPSWDVALVQQNIDPWQGGFRTYERSLEVLLDQSNRAIAEHDPDVVIWSETSFVPSIDYHTRYRTDQERYELVRTLRVPFTELFPIERQFAWLHRMLVENDTTFWEAGTDATVFELDGVRFSTPICFEDTFGYLSRDFVRAGAQIIVNLTNDLWSYSEPSAMQHLGMAVFRTVENRRSMVRSTNGGMTAIIDPNGAITDMYPPFREGYLAGTVPIYTERDTLYNAWGDWLAWVFTGLAGIFLLVGVLRIWSRSLIDKARATIGK